MSPPIPITILTGVLGAGKTTLLLNLIPQLPPPPQTRLCLLKNEFGSVAVDSRLLASASATPTPSATPGTPARSEEPTGASPVAGVQELLNGCICCNLVGQLGDALEVLRTTYNPTRIVIETSGSAFPATLAMEVNRLSTLSSSSSTGATTEPKYFLDGTILVVDCENFKGYEDTSYTAKLQAAYTDLVVLNKWEECPGGERRVEDVVDSIRSVAEDVPVVRSHRGWVDREVLLGVDRGMGKLLDPGEHIGVEQCRVGGCSESGKHNHTQLERHMDEVDVLSVRLPAAGDQEGNNVDYSALEKLLTTAPKDEVYRIKALFRASKAPPKPPVAGAGVFSSEAQDESGGWFILNWAFKRWTVTRVDKDNNEGGDVCDLTVVLAPGEGRRWKKKIETGGFVVREGAAGGEGLILEKVV